MKELIEKISSYNIFNYLFPGILFVVISEQFTSYVFIMENIFEGFVTYYFIGLIISRFGSLVIEPIYKKNNFSDYYDFIEASKKDKKIPLLSEQNNMYRTIISMLVLIFFLKIYDSIEVKCLFLTKYRLIILTIVLIVLFVFSYKKQINYIKSRVEFWKEKEGEK